jgi:hypothetical protein
MVTADMYWGSSDIPSGVPQDLIVNYNAATGRGLEIGGKVTGPGCGDWSCGDRWATLTFLGRFYLGTDRMPDRGCRFTSAPQVLFLESYLYGYAGASSGWDNSSAKCGLRLRQNVYSGGYLLGMREQSFPRIIDMTVEDFYERYAMPASLQIPSITWELDRSRTLQIDIEVRFTIYVEGDGTIGFDGVGTRNKFVFDVPQWAIYATDA